MLTDLESRFRQVAPAVDFCSMRFQRSVDQSLSVRQSVPLPVGRSDNAGVMITVIDGGGYGYGATSDLSAAGLKRAADQAAAWAKKSAGACVVDFRKVQMPEPTGQYEGPNEKPWQDTSLSDKFDMLMAMNEQLKVSDKIADWSASIWHRDVEMLIVTAGGGSFHQTVHLTAPQMRATAAEAGESQTRTFGGFNFGQQGCMEVLERYGMPDAPPRVAAEAMELLAAPNCPSGKMDLLLGPDQMVLQIHESIGHPLELDRILGDERNYAGTSFVTPEMIGNYRYGSDLLNIAFDPTLPMQFASYGRDDEGAKAEKQYLIKNGILVRVLGGTVSQARTGLPGVSNARADTWNRPPIDRMANINLEPGDSTFDDMVASVQRGVYGQLLVHRRQPKQVPVRLRVRPSHRERQTRGDRQEPELSRHFGDVLAEPQGRRRTGERRGDGHAQLRQGRAEPEPDGRAFQPGLPVRQRGRFRRRISDPASEGIIPCSSYFLNSSITSPHSFAGKRCCSPVSPANPAISCD